MARTGRPPAPLEAKKKRGTARPDRVPNLGNLAAVPAAQLEPAEMDPAAALEVVLEAGRVWLAATDSVALAMLREALEERTVLRAAVFVSQSPDARKALRELDKQIIGQLSALGFDPAARSRLGLAEVKAASTLEKLRAQRGN
jgi:hypothetical protein